MFQQLPPLHQPIAVAPLGLPDISAQIHNLTPQICDANSTGRCGIDSRKSMHALRIWDAVARCLEEISDSIDQTDSKSPFPSSTQGPSSVASEASQTRDLGSSHTNRQSIASGGGSRRAGSVSSRRSSATVSGLLSHAETFSPAVSQVEPRALYPCPFRKRNPALFNTRDHEICAKTQWHAISELRYAMDIDTVSPVLLTPSSQHVVTHHKQQSHPHKCRRCKSSFRDRASLDQHLMLPKQQMCDLRAETASLDPEDGISDEIGDLLLSRGNSGGVEDLTWEELWKLIFPMDAAVPGPGKHSPTCTLHRQKSSTNKHQTFIRLSNWPNLNKPSTTAKKHSKPVCKTS